MLLPLETLPAWLPIAVTVLLAVVLAFLYLSMRRNLRKIDFDDGSQADSSDADAPDGAARTGETPKRPDASQG